METTFAAAAILTVPGLILFLGLQAVAIWLAHQPRLSAARLSLGYLGALAALAVLVAATSYVSPEEAVAVWHVPPDHYRQEMVREFAATYITTAAMAMVGISVVGLPALVWLHRCKRDTAINLVAASVAISLVFGLLSYLAMRGSSNIELFGWLGFLLLSHGVLATGVALGARLPWALRLEP